MVAPNIVCEGKGRYLWQTHYDREDYEDLQASDRNILSPSKTGIKIAMIPGSGTTVVNHEVVIYNDSDDEEMTVNVSWKTLLPTGVTVKIYDGVTEKTAAYDIEVAALETKTLRVEFTVATTASACKLASVIFNVYDTEFDGETEEEYEDTCCAVLFTQAATYTDVMKQYDGMLTDKAVFSSQTYTAQQITEEYIKSATEEVACFLNMNWRTAVPCEQMVKQYVVYKCMMNVLLRLCSYSATGAQIWDQSIRLLRDEINILQQKIVNYN